MIKWTLNDILSPHSSLGDRCLAALIALLMLFAFGLLGWLVFILVNSAGIAPTKTTVTVVEEKQVIPAYTVTTLVMSGKVMVPITTYYPESRQLCFKIDGQGLKSTVDKKFFDRIKTGESIEVDYGRGRLNGSYEPVRIRRVHDK